MLHRTKELIRVAEMSEEQREYLKRKEYVEDKDKKVTKAWKARLPENIKRRRKKISNK